MTAHPYRDLPDYAFWSRSVASPVKSDVDPVVKGMFQITESDRVATAGSCFAQHIARHLKANGFNFLVTEMAHPITPHDLVAKFNYGVFSARYGNLYTSRQLLQLFRRAYGEFQPAEDIWQDAGGHYVDPFRPQIQPGGFLTREEHAADRAQHFRCVRKMFEELDVFVFTLGLTEAWMSAQDGAIYPLCPGVAGGTFDSTRHRFVNLGVEEVARDMQEFIDRLRGINPKAKVILTVSPVPLVATAEDRHVLVSTTYSKSVLRVAAEQVARSRQDVVYFPSYEIITGNHARGSYFADDLRSVTEEGVGHVMRLFLKHYTGREAVASGNLEVAARVEPVDDHTAKMTELAEVNCDEIALEKFA